MRVQEVYKFRARLLFSSIAQNAAGARSSSSSLDPEQTRPGNDLRYETHHTAFDRKIVLVTAAFLFLLVAVLAFHALIRCLLPRRFLPAATPFPSPSDNPPSKPMKKRHVDALPTFTFTLPNHSSMAAQCPICLADFHEGDVVRVLPTCQHGFHVECVNTWLYKQASCPTCRADLLKGGEQAERRSRAVEVRVVITARGDLSPTLEVVPTPQLSPKSLQIPNLEVVPTHQLSPSLSKSPF